MSEHDESLMGALRALLAAAKGGPPPMDAIERLGGWHRVADELSAAVDDPASVVLIRIVARDAHPGDTGVNEALGAIVEAVLTMESAAGFAESLDALLASPAVLDTVAERLADGLLAQLTTVLQGSAPSPQSVFRAASALEAATRLGVGGYGSKYALLAALDRFRAPAPKRLGAAVVRSVGTAVDYWPDAASLIKVVEVVSGLTPATGPQFADADPEDVASDASWVLANIELAQALRADTQEDMLGHLDSSVGYLRTGVETYGRDDAMALAPVLEVVGALTRAQPDVASLEAALPATKDLEKLIEQQTKFNLTLSGLNHWYADVKRQTTAAWVMLVEDLAHAQQQLAKEAFYRPEAAIDDLLQVYLASRSVEIVRRAEDLGGVLGVVQPVIEAGFASKTAFVANLDVYTRELAERLHTVDADERPALLEQHEVAAHVLAEARAVLARCESPGKGNGGTATLPLPRQLDQLFGADPELVAKLAELGQDNLVRLEAAVAGASVARRPSLQETRVLRDLSAALSASPDYVREVKDAVDEVVFAMVRFVGLVQNAQADARPYLFESNPTEKALQHDLHQFLLLAFGPDAVGIEVTQVGGGRADLRVKYAGFSVYLELKVDDTKKPLSEKGAYLNQAVTYQATDVRIGFVVALRAKAFSPAGAHPHLTSLFSHATVDVSGDSDPRHLVLVDVPGNRSSPAAKKAKV